MEPLSTLQLAEALAPQRLLRDCTFVPEFEGFGQHRDPNPLPQVEEDLGDLLRTAARVQVTLQELFVSPVASANRPPGGTRTALTAVR